jgi:hypothetical protein
VRARLLAATIAAAGLSAALAVASPAASAAPVLVQAGTSDAAGSAGAAGSRTALYVDSGGAAHVAWVLDGSTRIAECTIPSGGHSCGAQTTLTTDAVTRDGEISTIKYLQAGNDTAYLAVGIWNTTEPAPFDAGLEGPYSETEVFSPGQSTGLATGDVYVGGGGSVGDVVLEPDASGIDVVGLDEVQDDLFDIAPANEFEFESLVPGGSDSPAAYLGVKNAEAGAGDYPLDLTKLPQGQTAVLADDITPGKLSALSPVGMYVEPPSGGPFSAFRSLGISGPIETDDSPSGQSYVLNVELAAQDHPKHSIDTLGSTMELYRFRATSLVPVGAVGLAANLDLDAVGWDQLPPTNEDAEGNFYAAWLAPGSFDGCPGSLNGLPGDGQTDCLVYRRVSSSGVTGPTVVLIGNNNGKGSANPAGLGPIAVNTRGAGWMLYTQHGAADSSNLFAEPLTAAAAATSPPAVNGSTVAVPITCAGGADTNCAVQAELTTTAGGAARDARAARVHTTVLARITEKLKGGHSTKLVLGLDKAAKRVLARKHRLVAQLLISETVGAINKPTTVLSKRVTFSSRR